MKFHTAILLCLVGCALSAHLPPQVVKCPAGDDACLAKAIEDAIKFFANGNKELGIVSVNPLAVSAMTIGAGKNAVNLEQKYTDMKISGFSNVKIVKAHYDPAAKTISFAGEFQEDALIEGDYDMKGKVLLLPVEGKGPFKMILKNLKATIDMQFVEVERKGKKFLNIVGSKLKLEPGQIVFKFEKLFNDANPELADVIQTTLNENWKEVFEDVRSGYEDNFAEIFKQIGGPLFHRVPADEIFS